MPSFPGVDFLDFDSLLSDEEKLARQTARQFVDDEIMPIIEQYNREGKFPVQLVPQMAELGLFGASLKGYGCAGMSNVEYGLVTQELERGDSGLRSFISVQSALVMYPIHAFGSDAQKDKWLPLLQQGKAIGCFGLTEPQFGSNPGGMLTRAVKKGDSYILNGEKMWITNGSISDVAVIWAKTEDDKIRGFLVEKGTPGYKAWDVHGKYSLRASVTSGLAMTDCKIPATNLLPGVEGLKGPLSCLNQARYGIGWGAIGAAMACYDSALTYAKQRKQFNNKPIASHQLVQEKLVWMINEITKAQLLALQVGKLKDHGRVHPSHISMLKMNNVWMALETARMARQILGANGIVDDYPIMRHMNNLESVITYEGTHDIHKLIIGERITGIAGFRAALLIMIALLLFAPRPSCAADPATVKPKIRAVTAFVRIDRAHYKEQIQDTLNFLRHAKSAFEKSGYEVQTIRITTQPFPEYTRGLSEEETLAFFREYDALAIKEGFDASIGPAMMKDTDDPREAELLAKILANAKTLEGSVFIGGEDGIH
jgi:glutaryl-CoA dehydrogenase